MGVGVEEGGGGGEVEARGDGWRDGEGGTLRVFLENLARGLRRRELELWADEIMTGENGVELTLFKSRMNEFRARKVCSASRLCLSFSAFPSDIPRSASLCLNSSSRSSASSMLRSPRVFSL